MEKRVSLEELISFDCYENDLFGFINIEKNVTETIRVRIVYSIELARNQVEVLTDSLNKRILDFAFWRLFFY